MSRIAVVGAGIAGLAAAARLAGKHDVVVFEREGRAGGKIRTEQVDGFAFDWGPNGVLAGNPALRALLSEIGLAGELTPASPAAAKRFIYWNGALHALPAKPPDALRMSLLSPLGKLRALGDLFARAPASEDPEESVDAFMRRHFGAEVAERIVAPALLGVSGGDARETSVDAAFPRVRELERTQGSVIRGMARARGGAGRLSSFGAAGMQRLTDRLAELLGERIRFGAPVERVERHGAGWRVHHRGGSGARAPGDDAADVDALIVATPADAAARLLAPADDELAALLRRIPYAPMRVVGIAFASSDVPAALDGFGFLAARDQGVRILGAVYTSSLFREQAPEGAAYLRVFLGGAVDPGAAALDPQEARALVRADLRTVLGVTAEPLAYQDVVWPRAIPQYRLDHRALVSSIEARVASHPGLGLTGNAYRGLGVADAVRDGRTVAGALTGDPGETIP